MIGRSKNAQTLHKNCARKCKKNDPICKNDTKSIPATLSTIKEKAYIHLSSTRGGSLDKEGGTMQNWTQLETHGNFGLLLAIFGTLGQFGHFWLSFRHCFWPLVGHF